MAAETLATEAVAHIFAPDAVLPAQTIFPPAEGWLQRLCLAVLDDALKCLGVGGTYGGPRARARTKHEAWAWVLSDADYCFSFATVCSVLYLDAQAVRHQLRHYFTRGALPAGVSRQLRQPPSRAPSARGRARRRPILAEEGAREAGKNNPAKSDRPGRPNEVSRPTVLSW